MNYLEIREWFKNNRSKLSRNGVWFSGGEPGTMEPSVFDSASLRVLIVRLSAYDDVASGITHQYLFQMAKEVDGCYVDMAFLPPERDLALMEKAGIPLLTGTTSKRPAMQFDVIAVSNSVLQELLNLPLLMKLSSIPLSFENRRKLNAPFVLLGGSNSYCHSILHGETGEGEGLVDAVLCGDGEGSFGKILEIFAQNPEFTWQERIERVIAEVCGIYLPRFYQQSFNEAGQLVKIEASENAPFPVKVNKACLNKLEQGFVSGPLLYDGKSAGSSHVILTAGCPSFCSFCKESWEQKPYRERPVERAIADALLLKADQGLQEISLMTFNLNTYSGIFELLTSLDSFFDRVALKSQRFDSIARMPELLDRQLESGKRTYTCAMEGVSARLRSFLQKNLSESDLMQAFEILFKKQIRQLKIFLILTGYENDSDIEDFKEFLASLKSLQNRLSNRTKLTFSFATLFRPPLTPFQFSDKRSSINEMTDCLAVLVEEIKKSGFECRISAPVYDAIVSEYVAYADRRATQILVKSSVEKKFVYRGEINRICLQFLARKHEGSGVQTS